MTDTTSMKAMTLIKYGQPDTAFDMRAVNRPKPGLGEVLIKTKTSGLNFADVMARRGLYEDAPPLPAVIGYDVAGTICELGPGVKNYNLGDEVVAMTRFGGYAEYALASVIGMMPKPKDLSWHAAPALATQGSTAYYCVYEAASLYPGDKVLIHAAAGGVGSMLVQMALAKDCHVIATASTSKLDQLAKMGCHDIIDYTTADFKSVIEGKYGKNSVDTVFDSLGGKVFKKGFQLLAPGGRMVFYGASTQLKGSKTSKLTALKAAVGFGVFTPIILIMHSRSLIGVNMLRIADHRPQVLASCFKGVGQLVDQNHLNVFASRAYPIEDIHVAHANLENRATIGKLSLLWP